MIELVARLLGFEGFRPSWVQGWDDLVNAVAVFLLPGRLSDRSRGNLGFSWGFKLLGFEFRVRSTDWSLES